MLTFLITTSTKLASISLFNGDNMLANINVNVKRTHSTTILEQVQKAFEWTGTSLEDVENVVISVGPGSFTGVRIAMSLIKGLFCLSKDVKIYSVKELEAIRYNAKNYADYVVSGIDSRKGKIYYCIYHKDEKIVPDSIGNIKDVVDYTLKLDGSIVFAGDILEAYKDEISRNPRLVSTSSYSLAIDSKVYYDMFKAGLLHKETIEGVVPYYLEKSQAEKDYKGD